jgi:AcrR family transcriptional regulator
MSAVNNLTKYDTHVFPFLEEIGEMRRAGATMSQIAKHLNLSGTQLARYMSTHDELKEALREATLDMQQAMAEIAEQGLFAKLSDRENVKVEQFTEQWWDEKSNVTRSHKLERRRLVLADTTAIIFALKNFNPERWDSDSHQLAIAKIRKVKFDMEADIERAEVSRALRKLVEMEQTDDPES